MGQGSLQCFLNKVPFDRRYFRLCWGFIETCTRSAIITMIITQNYKNIELIIIVTIYYYWPIKRNETKTTITREAFLQRQTSSPPKKSNDCLQGN